ncbi:MAG TPA: hypothetical protein VKA92_06845 [Segetibacter sp.]|nr:hypothetical protein [Segetibacter sp.]
MRNDIKAFLITEKSKQDVVDNTLQGKYDPEMPSQFIQSTHKSVHGFLDEDAAGKLIRLIP